MTADALAIEKDLSRIDGLLEQVECVISLPAISRQLGKLRDAT